jgi:hypothetical protein
MAKLAVLARCRPRHPAVHHFSNYGPRHQLQVRMCLPLTCAGPAKRGDAVGLGPQTWPDAEEPLGVIALGGGAGTGLAEPAGAVYTARHVLGHQIRTRDGTK